MSEELYRSIRAVFPIALMSLLVLGPAAAGGSGTGGRPIMTLAAQSSKFVAHTVLSPSRLGVFATAADWTEDGTLAVVAGLAVSQPNWTPPRSASERRAALVSLQPPDYKPSRRSNVPEASWARAVRLSPLGGFAAVALTRDDSSAPALEIRRLPSLEKIAESTDGWTDVRFVSEGILATASEGNRRGLRLWDFLKDSVVVEPFPVPLSVPTDPRFAFSDRRGLVAVSGADEILVWTLGQPSLTAKMKHTLYDQPENGVKPAIPEDGQYYEVRGSGAIAALEFSTDGRLLASVRNLYSATVRREGDFNKEQSLAQEADIIIWDARLGLPVATFRKPGAISSLSFFPEAKLMAAAFQDTIWILQVDNGRDVLELLPDAGGKDIGIVSLRVTDDQTVSAITGDGAIHIWRIDPR